MKNICVVMEKHVSVHFGGAEFQADLLARELCGRAGVRVYYLARSVPPAEVAADWPYVIRRIGSAEGRLRKRAVFFDALQLWNALSEIRPAAIYQRMKLSYTGICAAYARRAAIPLFFHAAIDSDVSPSRRSGRKSANIPFDVVEAAIANYGIRRASTVIVQTRRQATLMRSFDRTDAVVIPNFQPLPARLPDKPAGRLSILWVANIHAHKGPELFLELAARMSGRKDIEFVMIGRPNDRWSHGRGMTEIHEAKNVRYLGKLPVEEVNAWMDRAAVFVNTSSLEGFPNTFIQAWSRGAVVTTLTIDIDGGLNELGIGYRCGDLDRMIAVIDELVRSEPLRRSVRERAFAYVQEHHSMKNAARLADLILPSPPAAS
jgi:glycosyltransferase involved in cell wall biosynthesis